MSFFSNLIRAVYCDLKKQRKKAVYYYTQCQSNTSIINYRIGLLYSANKQWEKAEEFLRRAISSQRANPHLFYKLGFVLEKQKKFREALDFYKKALDLRKNWAAWKEHYIFCLSKASKDPAIAKDINEYIQEFNSPEVILMKAGLQHSSGQYWQEAETLKHAIDHGYSTTEIHFQLGKAYTELKNWQEAAQEFCICVRGGYTEEDVFYHYAYALSRMGDQDSAEEFYELAEAFASMGVSKLHDKYGREQECAFRLYGDLSPAIASSTGRKLEQAFCYDKALECYEIAINEYTFDCGLMAEMSGHFEQAIRFYTKAIAQFGDAAGSEGWYYRLGFCFEQSGLLEKACESYLKCLPSGTPLPETIDTELSCTDSRYFPAGYFYRQGQKLMQAGQLQAACDKFRLTRVIARYTSSSRATYNRSWYFRLKANYTEFCETQPISPRLCFFESFSGRKMTCNPFAIFLEMHRREEFSDWTFVWCVESPESIAPSFRNDSRCVFVKRNSLLYLYALATAKIIINNSTFGSFFARRPGQLYLNTWHGTPWKYMGIDIKNSFMEYANTQRNFLHATHILSPNPHTTRILIDRYDIATLYRGKVLELGYPRIDLTLNPEARIRLRKELGVKNDEKLVLYMPTFRGVMGEQAEVPPEMIEATKALSELDCKFFFSGHYFYEREFQEKVGRSILPPLGIENNELIAACDILITDYSSIAFDYMATGKEIIYYIYDREQYERDRGLYLNQDIFPGKKCIRVEELVAKVRASLEEKFVVDEKYKTCIRNFCPHEDGKVSSHVVDALVHDLDGFELSEVRTAKKTILFYTGSFSTNGITRSFLNLMHQIDYEAFDVSVIITGASMSNEPNRLELFAQLPKKAHVLGHVGSPNMTIDEERVQFKFNKHQYLDSPTMRTLWDRMLARDYHRIFGCAHFDYIVQFDGYSPYWTGLFARSDARKAVFLHNTMKKELHCKYPNLENVFREFSCYDKIVSVSEALQRENQSFLTREYKLDPSKFCYVENTQDFERIISLAEMPLSEQDWNIPESSTVFITIGRLSIEKDHKKLINAFVRVHKEIPTIRLIILGEGPLFSNLYSQISELEAEEYVSLLGYKSNPYPYIKKADCFILPSNHEGQPMVLFEAMALGKPIIATDIPSNRGVLDRFHYGFIAHNSTDGLTNSILEYLKSSDKKISKFDMERYNHSCMHQFYAMLGTAPRMMDCRG